MPSWFNPGTLKRRDSNVAAFAFYEWTTKSTMRLDEGPQLLVNGC